MAVAVAVTRGARSVAMDSMELVAKIAAGQDGVLTARQCLAAGMRWREITFRCRAGAWRAMFRGVYYIHPDEPSHRTRVRAGLLSLGPAAVATLTSAAYLHELPYAPDDRTVHASVPPERNRLDQPGLLARQLVIPGPDQTTVAGMRVTTPARTLADLALRLHRPEIVSMLDGALYQERISDADLLLIAAMVRRRRGAVRARRRLAEVDGRAASPLETRIRLICADAGMPPEALQYPITTRYGYVVAVADLAWPSRKLIVEVDGRLVHGLPDALYHDRRRQNELAALGWTVLRFTWADLQRPGYIVASIRRALATAATRRQR